ncbi:hypothetical protein NECAME_09078 [Necator americanus]|uniref:Collagen triple helix repeat protein n=1 Tax=Necator americanus TaxID=51031 RepID=W2TFD4_NECAM|nr:hypothetical protein NECAME_09078 [Necator americanus]ETN80558.1 hypothetical protein NECAME_09078 [Necator americanus]
MKLKLLTLEIPNKANWILHKSFDGGAAVQRDVNSCNSCCNLAPPGIRGAPGKPRKPGKPGIAAISGYPGKPLEMSCELVTPPCPAGHQLKPETTGRPEPVVPPGLRAPSALKATDEAGPKGPSDMFLTDDGGPGSTGDQLEHPLLVPLLHQDNQDLLEHPELQVYRVKMQAMEGTLS